MSAQIVAITVFVVLLSSCSSDRQPTQTSNDIGSEPDATKDAASDVRDLGASDAAADTDGGSEEEFEDTFMEECDGMLEGSDCLETDENLVIRLNRERKLGIKDGSFNETEGLLRLEVSETSPLLEGLAVGKIVVRWRKSRSPLIHRVDELRWDGTTAEMRVSKVGIKDAFRRGRIKRRFNYDDQLTEVMGLSYAEIAGITLGPNDCSGTIVDNNNIQNGEGLRVDVTDCRFNFTPRIELDIHWGFTGIADYVHFEAGGTTEVDFEVQVDSTGQIGFGGERRLAGLPDVPIPGFPILTIGVDVFGGYSVYASSELSVSTGFDYESDFGIGFSWALGRGFDSYNWGGDEFTERGPVIEFDGQLEGTVYIEPRLRIAIVNVLGASAGLRAFASIDFDAHVETVELQGNQYALDGYVCYDLGAGLDPTLSVDLQILGIGIAEKTWLMQGFRKSLAHSCTDYQAVSTSACTPQDECIVDDDCLAMAGGTYNACVQRTCSSNCECGSFLIPDCCTRDFQCDDGDDRTADYCDTAVNRCESEFITCVVDSDCDDGIDSTVDYCRTSGTLGLCRFTTDTEGFCEEDSDCPQPDDDALQSICVGIRCETRTAATPQYSTCINELSGNPTNCRDGDPSTTDQCIAGECVNATAVN